MRSAQLHSRPEPTLKTYAPMLISVVAGGALALTGCSANAERTPSTPDVSPSIAQPSPTKAEEAARQQILTVYAKMRAEQVTAYAAADARGTNVSKYATGKALATIESNLRRLRQGGVVFTGKPKSTTTITKLTLTASPKTATVNECWDTSQWTPVDKITGNGVATDGQPRRYNVTGTVRTTGHVWMVVEITLHKDDLC